jgi:hypothetical protein
MMNVLAQDINWDNKRKLASAEASSLRIQTKEYFAVWNKKTNKAVVWVLRREERDRDGDVVFWEYSPTWDSGDKLPQMKDWKLLVYND